MKSKGHLLNLVLLNKEKAPFLMALWIIIASVLIEVLIDIRDILAKQNGMRDEIAQD